jgi:hypothetical protein
MMGQCVSNQLDDSVSIKNTDNTRGIIHVGTINFKKGKRIYPVIPDNFEMVEVMTYSNKQWWELSPYALKNVKGHIMENLWQFSKVYPKVPESRQTYSRYDSKVIWNHPSEVHTTTTGNPNINYYNWRNKGYAADYAIRYPVGFSHNARSSCLYNLYEGKRYNYVNSREHVYFKLYSTLVRKQDKYKKLLISVADGKNIVICEVDGPHQKSLQYYIKKGASPELIKNNQMVANYNNLRFMQNDIKHPFGHGYCLARCLLEDLHNH